MNQQRPLLCRWFGCYIREYRYGRYYGGCADGIGRNHAFYEWECERCGSPINLYTHIPPYYVFSREKLDEYQERLWSKQ